MSQPILTLNQLCIGYHRKKPLFENLQLKVSPGEFICLLGPNGTGKSTLLKTLLGLLPPLQGDVQLCQKKLEHYSPLERAKVLSALLTDRLQTDQLQVLELVLLGRYPHRKGFGKLSSEDTTMAQQALKHVHALHLMERKVDTLSDGEKQRVLLARALAQDPQLLILDEPTSFLDYPHKVETFHFLKKWTHEQQRSVIMSTHDLDLSLTLADRIILLQPNSTIIEGAPEDLVLNGSLDKVFHSKHLKIDHQSGKFKVKLDTHTPIGLTGEGEIACWTEKALNRAGYYLDQQAEKSIAISNHQWTYKDSKCEKQTDNLYDLIQFLKDQTPS